MMKLKLRKVKQLDQEYTGLSLIFRQCYFQTLKIKGDGEATGYASATRMDVPFKGGGFVLFIFQCPLPIIQLNTEQVSVNAWQAGWTAIGRQHLRENINTMPTFSYLGLKRIMQFMKKKNHLNRCQKMGGDRNLRENGYVYMYY